ncbi:hypothetical protein V8F33_004587 [Rhypophila sp. PSN 637]
MANLTGDVNSPMDTSGSSGSALPPMPPGESTVTKQGGSRSNKGPEPKLRLVVALNFGATHTSVAYLFDHRGHNANIKQKIGDIRILEAWPCHKSASVPSEISYSPTTRGRRQWGYDIDDGAQIHDSLRLRLEGSSMYQELVSLHDLVKEAATNPGLSVSVPPSLHKSPELMAADFLRKVAEHLRDEIDSNVGRHVLVTGFIPLDLVVSYPSLWPEVVKRRYFQVIESAFDVALLPTLRHIYFLAEAEAVSQWCVWSENECLREHGIRKGTSVIVCDSESSSMKAIGTSHAFDHILPGPKFRKIGYLARADAGWELVETGFESLFVARLHSTDLRQVELLKKSDPDSIVRSRWNMIRQRFQPIMHGFDGIENRLGWPIMLPKGFQGDNGHGWLALSSDDLKGMFDPSIRALIHMLSDQIELADHAGTPAKAIILSGRFVNHIYVRKQLEDFASTRRVGVVGVEYSGDSSRGSVLHGLGLSTTPVLPVTKLAHHYGIGYYDSNHHMQPSSSSHGRKMPDLVEWIFAKGEVVFPDADKARTENIRILRRYKPEDCAPGRMSRVVVVIYGGNTPSGDFQSLEQQFRSLNLEFDLSFISEDHRRLVTTKSRFFAKSKSSYLDVELSVTFSVSLSLIAISVSCGGKLLAEKQVSDKDE